MWTRPVAGLGHGTQCPGEGLEVKCHVTTGRTCGQLLSSSPGSEDCHPAAPPVPTTALPSRTALSPREMRRPGTESGDLAFCPDGLFRVW